jgi:RNase H-fold protein (predicted Holliday junction resolvase)
MQCPPAIHAELRVPVSAHQERTSTMSLEEKNQQLAGKKASGLREHIDDYMASRHHK